MCGNKFRADNLKPQYSIESAEVESEPIDEPVQTESAKIEEEHSEPMAEPMTEERTDFQKYVDENISIDIRKHQKEYEAIRRRAEEKGKLEAFRNKVKSACEKLALSANDKTLDDSLDKIARKYIGERGSALMLADKFCNNPKLKYLELKEGKDIKELTEELLYAKKKLVKAVTSDEEDEQASSDQNERNFMLGFLCANYSWLMDLKRQ